LKALTELVLKGLTKPLPSISGSTQAASAEPVANEASEHAGERQRHDDVASVCVGVALGRCSPDQRTADRVVPRTPAHHYWKIAEDHAEMDRPFV
jgi:hypothetical protein